MKWVSEYREFLTSDEVAPSPALNTQVLSQIHLALNPKPWSVFAKLASIHAAVGTLNLLFCPYSEINIADGWGPMHFLMQWGESACMLGCGVLFIGGSVLVASLALRVEEVQVIRKNRWLQLSILSLGSITLLVCTNLLFLSGLFWIWVLGSMLGGLVTLELGWVLRKYMRAQ